MNAMLIFLQNPLKSWLKSGRFAVFPCRARSFFLLLLFCNGATGRPIFPAPTGFPGTAPALWRWEGKAELHADHGEQ